MSREACQTEATEATPMIDREKLALLLEHAIQGNWSAAASLYQELSLAAKGSLAEFFIDELAPSVRLRDVKRITVIVNDLTRFG